MTTLHSNTNLSKAPKPETFFPGVVECAKSAWHFLDAEKGGGGRVIYLYLKHRGTIYLIYVFTKGDAANLSASGRKAVREVAQQIRNQPHGQRNPV